MGRCKHVDSDFTVALVFSGGEGCLRGDEIIKNETYVNRVDRSIESWRYSLSELLYRAGGPIFPAFVLRLLLAIPSRAHPLRGKRSPTQIPTYFVSLHHVHLSAEYGTQSRRHSVPAPGNSFILYKQHLASV